MSLSEVQMQPQVGFTVEVGPNANPIMKVHAGGRVIPIDLTAAQSGELGRALLAVSAVCSSATPYPEGTQITSCHFPVEAWATGRSEGKDLPVLVVRVRGGTQLVLQFSPEMAKECAASLMEAAAQLASSAPSP
ncbi:hypothetical protein [Methylobacterium nodulans]|uniref:hypothetical protein n=1 Tax=Methylobacterium nodulans TaxID=114616 RepID=UPI001FCC4B62|nr:hypothetical protein [Methylobacterium nodulans]